MNKGDRLLVQIDKVFSFEDRKRSTVKRRRQLFDEKTGEHVFILEYRVAKGEHFDPKLRKEKGSERRNNKYWVGTPDGDFPDRHQVWTRRWISLGTSPRFCRGVDTSRGTQPTRQTAGTLPARWIPGDSDVETGQRAGIEPCSAPADGWQGTGQDDETAPIPAKRR